MRIHRFFTQHQFGKTVSLQEPELVHQIGRVLRLEPGEKITLFNGDGMEWTGRIVAVGDKAVEVEEESFSTNVREPQAEVDLYVAILKHDNIEWAVQKATEVGVRSVHPIVTEHTVKLNVNLERLRKIAREAAELSGRSRIPEITAPVPAMDAFANAEGRKVILDPGGGTLPKTEGPVALFIGPEGGWSETERNAAAEAGLIRASIGSTILRGETAAVIASYLAVNQ